jgi:hypothetical protein
VTINLALAQARRAVEAAEREAGTALVLMIEHEGLTVTDAIEWIGDQTLIMREVGRLRALTRRQGSDRRPSAMSILDPAQESLLRAAQTLHAAASLSRTDADADPGRYDLELGVHSVLWLSASLLPADLPLSMSAAPAGQVRELLYDAEIELRRFPIARYPGGTVDLVVSLCELIRRVAGELQ